MSKFQVDDLVIWQDEQSQDITGIITEVSKDGFRIDWDCPSPYGDEKNEVFYSDEFLSLKTVSDKPVIRLDTCRIRDKKICQLVD